MSLTWICPLEGPLLPFNEEVVEEECVEEPFAEVEEEADADLARPDGA